MSREPPAPGPAPAPEHRARRARLARLATVSTRDLVLLALATALGLAAFTWVVLRYLRPAPPSVVTISTGPDASSFQRAAERYQKAFAANGVTLRLLPSNGSLENLQRLASSAGEADLGFVQVGVTLPEAKPGEARRELATLGTIQRQPLYVLVHADAPPDRLSALAGKRVVIGPEGSGTRVLALRLLAANGIEPGGPTELLDLDDDLVGDALEQGFIDAAFLMGDSASPRVIRAILQRPGVHALALAQLDAYLRRFRDLDRIVIPRGAYDLAKDMPAADVPLLASSVELVARADLHPAISDLLLETLRQVHGRANLLQEAGQFPIAREHDLPLSADARRYYESGRRWFYRMLPFWAASLADRFLVVLVPLVLLLVPVFRLVPVIYRWRFRVRVYKVYGALLELEREVQQHAPPERAALRERLDAIERRAETLKLPLSFTDQLYVLREHVQLVRRRLEARAAPAPAPAPTAGGPG